VAQVEEEAVDAARPQAPVAIRGCWQIGEGRAARRVVLGPDPSRPSEVTPLRGARSRGMGPLAERRLGAAGFCGSVFFLPFFFVCVKVCGSGYQVQPRGLAYFLSVCFGDLHGREGRDLTTPRHSSFMCVLTERNTSRLTGNWWTLC
jgi:hypothetical protein